MTDVSLGTAAPVRAPAERLQPDRILRWREVKPLVGVSRWTWGKMVRAGTAPAGRQIGPGSVGWLEEEIVAFQLGLRPTLGSAE